MSGDLIDSNLIIYAMQPRHEKLRAYVVDRAPAVSVVSRVETLGYHRLDAEERALLEDFFDAAVELPVSKAVVEATIRLRRRRRMSLGDALIAGTATHHGLRMVTHNVTDFARIEGLEIFDPLA